MVRPQLLALIQGTLDLLILRTLSGRPLHGYGIAAAIAERTGGELAIDDAARYAPLNSG